MIPFRLLLVLGCILLLAPLGLCKGFKKTLGILLGDLDQQDGSSHVVAFEKGRLGFEKIEEHLQNTVFNERVEDNIEAAKGLLEEEISKPYEERNMELVTALQQFAALSTIKFSEPEWQMVKSKHICTRETFAILNRLNVATHKRSYKIKAKRGPLRRIELILAKLAQEHAQRCKQVYPLRFQKKIAKFAPEKLKRIDIFMSDVLDSRVKEALMNPLSMRDKWSAQLIRRVLTNFMQHDDSFKTRRDATLVINSMKKLVAGRSREMSILRKETPSPAPLGSLSVPSDDSASEPKQLVKNMLAIYLLKPCHEYTEQFGPDIFVPAENDATILDKAHRFKPSLGGQADDFIDGWVRYGFCFMLERDEAILTKRIHSLLLDE